MLLKPSHPALVKLLIAGLALWQAGAWLQRRLVHRRQAPGDEPSDLATWEGEGGSLRDAGGQTTPPGQNPPE